MRLSQTKGIMEKKLLLQEISDLVAAKEGISKKKAETFSRLLFETIEEGLLNDKYVKIKGLGTFKLVPVGDRESVNVNTGERIQISSHSKISFTPDPLIRDLVNKPFSHFQTVILNDETDIEELESVGTPEELEETNESDWQGSQDNTGNIEPEEQPNVTPKSEIDEEEKPLAADDTEDNPHHELNIPEIPLPTTASDETEPTSGNRQSSENQLNTKETVIEEPVSSTSEETESSENEDIQEMPQEEMNVAGTAPSTNAQTETNNISAEASETTSENLQEDAAEEATEDEMAETNSTANETYDQALEYEECHHPCRRSNWWKIAVLAIFILLLMGLSYFAGYYKVFCPPCESDRVAVSQTTIASPEQETKANDSLKAERPDTLQASVPLTVPTEVQASDKEPSPIPPTYSPSVRYTIVGTKEKHVIKAGENLSIIARRTYGHKEFAIYIIKHNKIANPDNIVIGKTLKLPELKPDSVR